eukprot:494482-Hanusia_phi.AAC.2
MASSPGIIELIHNESDSNLGLRTSYLFSLSFVIYWTHSSTDATGMVKRGEGRGGEDEEKTVPWHQERSKACLLAEQMANEKLLKSRLPLLVNSKWSCTLVFLTFSLCVVPSSPNKLYGISQRTRLRGGGGEGGGREEWRVFRECTRMFYPYEELQPVMSSHGDPSDEETCELDRLLVRTKMARGKSAGDIEHTMEQKRRIGIRTRYLEDSSYHEWWRPGIINKMLWAACETGDNYEIDFLVRYAHADVNAVDQNINNLSALMRSVMNGREETVRCLIDRGADVNATDVHGSTALHYAALFGWPRIVEVLLEARIDRWKKNDMNKTALDSALEDVKVVPYDANRTPEEDDLIDPRRLLRGKGKRAIIAGDAKVFLKIVIFCAVLSPGSNWETVKVLREALGLPPPDMLHLTGDIDNFDWLEEQGETLSQILRTHPRTVFDMPPVLPDGFPLPEIPEIIPRDFNRWNTPWRFPNSYEDDKPAEQGRGDVPRDTRREYVCFYKKNIDIDTCCMLVYRAQSITTMSTGTKLHLLAPPLLPRHPLLLAHPLLPRHPLLHPLQDSRRYVSIAC